MNEVGVEYKDVVARLSLPTAEQTRRFVQHVAGAHSWYKHLPAVPPGRPFFFYLDPHAGMNAHGMGDRAERFTERFEGERVHYSSLPTVEYRARFGAWGYGVGPSAPLGDPEPALDEIEVMDPATGTWVVVPRVVVEVSRCDVTGFVHERGFTTIEMAKNRYLAFETAFRARAHRFESDPFVARHRALLEESSRDLQRLADAERSRQIEALFEAAMRGRAVLASFGCKPAWPRARFAPELFARVSDDPEDDAPRLVYADALESAGDPRGSLVQIMCRLSAGDRDDRAMAELEGELARAMDRNATLFADLRGETDWRRIRATIERGFVQRIDLSPHTLEAALAGELGEEPVRELVLRAVSTGAAVGMKPHPLFERCRSLDIEESSPEIVPVLLGAHAWTSLVHLGGPVDRATAQMLSELGVVGRLESLDLQATDDVDGVLSTLLARADPRRLKRLRVRSATRERSTPLASFSCLAGAPALESLDIDHIDVDPARLGDVASFASLRSLRLGSVPMRLDGALSKCPFPPSLQSLELGVERPPFLANNPSLSNLRHLVLKSSDPWVDRIVNHSLQAPVFASLVSLEVEAGRLAGGARRDHHWYDDLLRTIARLPLRRLALRGAPFHADRVPMLLGEGSRSDAEAALAAALVTLELETADDFTECLPALLGEARLPGIRRLFVRSGDAAPVDAAPAIDQALARLVEPGPPVELVHLALPALGSGGVSALVESERFAALAIVEAPLMARFDAPLSELRSKVRLVQPNEWSAPKWHR